MYDSRIRILMSYLAFLQEHLNHVPEGSIIYEKYRYRWFLPDGSHHRLYLEKDEQIIRESAANGTGNMQWWQRKQN